MRWALVHALQGQGDMSLCELARRVGRDVKRVHEDVHALIELGLIEKIDGGGVVCAFSSMHIDMQMHTPLALPALKVCSAVCTLSTRSL